MKRSEREPVELLGSVDAELPVQDALDRQLEDERPAGSTPWESPTVKLFRVSDRRLAGEIRVGHLNPQTQEFSM